MHRRAKHTRQRWAHYVQRLRRLCTEALRQLQEAAWQRLCSASGSSTRRIEHPRHQGHPPLHGMQHAARMGGRAGNDTPSGPRRVDAALTASADQHHGTESGMTPGTGCSATAYQQVFTQGAADAPILHRHLQGAGSAGISNEGPACRLKGARTTTCMKTHTLVYMCSCHHGLQASPPAG